MLRSAVIFSDLVEDVLETWDAFTVHLDVAYTGPYLNQFVATLLSFLTDAKNNVERVEQLVGRILHRLLVDYAPQLREFFSDIPALPDLPCLKARVVHCVMGFRFVPYSLCAFRTSSAM